TGNSERLPISEYKDEKLIGCYDNFIYKLPSGEIVAVFENVTERVQAEMALQESEERYRAIFEQAADSIVVIDKKTGDIVTFNDRAYEKLGYTRVEFEKLKIPDFEIIESVSDITKPIEKIVKERGEFFETKHRAKNGEIWDIHVNSRAISIAGKEYVQNIWHDITERVQAEERLRKSEARLRNLTHKLTSAEEQERKRISQELHDEIGQALTAITFNLAAIEAEVPLDLAAVTRGRLEETNDLVAQVLKQIRDLSLRMHPSILDDLGLLPAIRWYTDQFTKRMNITVNLDIQDIEGRLPLAFEMPVYRVVIEIMTNIARHARAKRVDLSLQRLAEKVSIFIKDDGVGFDLSELDKLAPHERGMGLMGIQERVDYLGGEVSIQSGKGRGTQVSIEIPLGGE
ncbi:MAG: PAS domain-containing sensor histidine kinase, partial [Anaerolineaceae bacterium]|nr:PAS domain-containing sensor histidine kinase [Anaerolineaceae bacterium]